MKSRLVLLTLALVLAASAVAIAGPGDPRLVTGVLEWPRALTSEPFLVVRGDDGVLYVVGITNARRDGAFAAGGRVSALGFEGRAANEITALGVGAGETPDAALARLQGRAPAPVPPAAAPAPVPVATAPAPATTPAPVATTAPAAAPTPAPVATAPAPTPAAPAPTTPAPAATPAPAPVPPATAPRAPAPVTTPAAAPSAPATPTPPASVSAPATPRAPAGAPSAPTAPATLQPKKPEPAAPPAAASVTHVSTKPAVETSVDNRRWSEVTGVVESLVGRTLILRSDEGRVAVDISSLSPHLDRLVTPGTTVKVYGVPVEVRFKAMGFFDPAARH